MDSVYCTSTGAGIYMYSTIITRMEDGSMDSVYYTSTGAGIYMYSTIIIMMEDGSMDSVCVSKIIPNNFEFKIKYASYCFIVLEGKYSNYIYFWRFLNIFFSYTCYIYLYIYKVVISVIFFIISQEPPGKFALNFDWGTRENHGIFLV